MLQLSHGSIAVPLSTRSVSEADTSRLYSFQLLYTAHGLIFILSVHILAKVKL